MKLKAPDRISCNVDFLEVHFLKLKESQMKTDEQQNRTDVQLKETIKEFRATQKLLGDLGLVQGEVAEELFYRSVKGLFSPLSLHFDRIRRNVKVKGHGVYDIVADDKKNCPASRLCCRSTRTARYWPELVRWW
jgi:hypothetical protein